MMCLYCLLMICNFPPLFCGCSLTLNLPGTNVPQTKILFSSIRSDFPVSYRIKLKKAAKCVPAALFNF